MWTLWTVETTDIYLWTTLTDVQDVMGRYIAIIVKNPPGFYPFKLNFVLVRLWVGGEKFTPIGQKVLK